MLNYERIIGEYYTKGSKLEQLLMMHSTQVADLAIKIAKHYGNGIDEEFIIEAAMLHDIGVFRTNAPSIFCNGNEPYIRHGIIGAEILLAHNLPKHARVCARHTGAGLTANDIILQNLPLPIADYLPETIEEKIICYADKFFSKSKVTKAKPIAIVREQMAKFGQESLDRFDEMARLFNT